MITASDMVAIAKGVAPAVLQIVSSAVAPLQIKIATLEAQLANVRNGQDGKDGKDAEPVDLDALAIKAAAMIPVPKDGKDGEAPDVEEVAKVAALLVPKAKDGQDGKDAQPVDLDAIVEKVVSLMPFPERGEKGDPGLNGKDGVDGKDGIGMAGVLINKDHHLVVTLSDGTMHELGPVVGRDGENGAEGPPGAPGANGLNGKDGTLENIYPVYDGERTVSFYYKNGDVPITGWSMKIPMLIDRGIWSSEKAYETGDFLSYSGSGWIAKADSQGKQPGTDAGAPFWRLAVKRGNDGKPGPKGQDGLKGKDGAPGRDGTRSY